MPNENLSVTRPAHWSVEHAFQLAEAVHENPGARVKRQHVVSKAVLGNYTAGETDAPLITMVDLQTRMARDVGIADAAIEKDFLRVDSLNSEQIWGRTETLIPAAVRAARDQCILARSDQLHVLRRAVALHFARSISTLLVVEQTWPKVRERMIQELADRADSRIAIEVQRRVGRSPTRQEILDFVEHSAATPIDELLRSGAYARVRIEQFYDQALERFESWGVEVLRVPSNDLVISDNPVVLACAGDDRRGATNRMAIGDAHTIVFPLAPDILISMGPKNGYATATRQLVLELNRSQIAGAHRFVFHRIGQDISDVISAHSGFAATSG